MIPVHGIVSYLRALRKTNLYLCVLKTIGECMTIAILWSQTLKILALKNLLGNQANNHGLIHTWNINTSFIA